jgi:FkbM family methyltransferase
MHESIKRLGRQVLGGLCRLPVRGRHRLVKHVGRLFAPADGEQIIQIGVHHLTIDGRLEGHRYMAYGLYEDAELRQLRRIVRPGAQVCDVGANIGYISAHLAEFVGPSGTVHAFEPSPTCLARLRRLADSSPYKNIQVNAMAVGERSAETDYYETDHLLSHGFGKIGASPSSVHSGVVKHRVRMVSLDDYREKVGNPNFQFVKIDVEGAESRVVQGMERMMRQGIRPVLLTEASCIGDLWEDFRRFTRILSAYAYQPYSSEGLRPLALDGLTEGTRLNVIWISREKSAA